MRSVQVSVIVPVFNAELYIGRCLRSLLKQTLDIDNYEIIVINDCSTDNTKQVINPFIGDINYLENNKKLGLPKTLNTGIKNAKGQFIIRVDADDYVSSHFLHILSLFLDENRKYQAIACDYKKVNELGKGGLSVFLHSC